MTSPQLARAARRLADRTSTRIADVAGARLLIGTVTTITARAASDGNALVYVTWRGKETVAAGYASSYTPGLSDRVLCALVSDQLIVLLPLAGQP